MWTTQHTADTDVPRDAVWRALREHIQGRRNVPGADVFELDGPFAVGSTVHVTPAGQETFDSTIVEIEEERRYADRTVFGDLVLIFAHELADIPSGTRVVHRLEIDGDGADSVAPELGPQIAADFPEAMRALFEAAHAIARG